MRNIKQLSDIRSYLNGFINSFSFFNLSRGKGSLGDRIIDYTNNSKIKNNSFAFASGYLTELISEFAVPIYVASTTDLRWYHILLADLAIKTIPRSLEKIVNRGKDKRDEILISRLL